MINIKIWFLFRTYSHTGKQAYKNGRTDRKKRLNCFHIYLNDHCSWSPTSPCPRRSRSRRSIWPGWCSAEWGSSRRRSCATPRWSATASTRSTSDGSCANPWAASYDPRCGSPSASPDDFVMPPPPGHVSLETALDPCPSTRLEKQRLALVLSN